MLDAVQQALLVESRKRQTLTGIVEALHVELRTEQPHAPGSVLIRLSVCVYVCVFVSYVAFA